jgi:hypothetical protein
VVAQGLVVALHLWSKIVFLWFNVIGCMAVVIVSLVVQACLPRTSSSRGA